MSARPQTDWRFPLRSTGARHARLLAWRAFSIADQVSQSSSSYPAPSADPAASTPTPPAAPDAAAAAAAARLDNDHLGVLDKIVRHERKLLVYRQWHCLGHVGDHGYAGRSTGCCDRCTAHHGSQELSAIHRLHLRFHLTFLRVLCPLKRLPENALEKIRSAIRRAIQAVIGWSSANVILRPNARKFFASGDGRVAYRYGREPVGSDARIRSEKSAAPSAASAAALIRERRRSSSNGKEVSTRPEW
jgi:hypothetical protein